MNINYYQLCDEEKLDLLRLLYHDLKNKEKKDIEQEALVLAETHIVYSRLKMRSN